MRVMARIHDYENETGSQQSIQAYIEPDPLPARQGVDPVTGDPVTLPAEPEPTPRDGFTMFICDSGDDLEIVNGQLQLKSTTTLTAEAAARQAAEIRQKRRNEYPPIEDLADALVKQASSDPAVVDAGVQQEADYKAACLLVKQNNPLP